MIEQDGFGDEVDKKDIYWARKSGDDFLGAVETRIKKYLRHIAVKHFAKLPRRSWELYHGLKDGANWEDTAITTGGEFGDQLFIFLNQYRSLMDLLKTYITQYKPEWDTIANNGDAANQDVAQIGNIILDSIMLDNTNQLNTIFSDCVENALILGQSYVWNPWDPMAGTEVGVKETDQDVPDEEKSIEYTGDIQFRTKFYSDVFFDPFVADFKLSNWVVVRNLEYKHDVLTQHPEKKDEILAGEASSGADLSNFSWLNPILESEDHIWVYYCYHKATPTLPKGRYVKYITSHILEEAQELPDGHIPVHRLVAGKWLGCNLPYSRAWDLLGPQEALNAIGSIILTNQEKLGLSKMWFKSGEPINQGELSPGNNVIQSETPPIVLKLLETAAELFKTIDMYIAMMEQQSGVNSVTRGGGEASQSGAAQKFQSERTIQSASQLVSNLHQLIADVGTSTLKTYANRLKDGESRPLKRLGVNESRYLTSFKKEDLVQIESVSVIPGDPSNKTLAGRVNLAMNLAQMGVDPSFLPDVVKTGNLDRIDERNQANRRLAQAENESMIQGKEIFSFMPEQDHATHLGIHLGMYSTPETCANQMMRAASDPHNKQHIEALLQVGTQQLMLLLGYKIPPPAPQGPGMGPGGPPPGIEQSPAPSLPKGPPPKPQGGQAQLKITGGNVPPAAPAIGGI